MGYREDYYGAIGAGVEVKDRMDPLLVCLHDSVRHYKQHDKSTQAHERMVNSVMALLDANLTNNEKIMAADVLITLVKQAEQDLRKSLADKLAVRDDLPDTLLHFLAYGDIELAEKALLYSPLLSDTDLMYVAQSKGTEHWQAIASREKISHKLVRVLADKQDVQVASRLIANTSIELEREILEKFVPLAMKHEFFANEYIEYKTLPKELAVNLYWHVSNILRYSIADKFKVAPSELDRALEDCVQDFTDSVMHADSRPSLLMKEVAESYHAQDKISERFLVNVLRRRQGRFFVALFSKKTGLSYQVLSDMMRQKGGQGIAVACRALNISKESFISIFLLARAVTAACDPVNADELKMAMRYYDSLTHKMSKDILTKSIAK